MWELDCEESWAPKNWCFELWCWIRLLRVPWTARRCNQSILKEISPGISLEGMVLKLKLQYFGHVIQRVDSLENTLMLGGIGGRRRRGQKRMRRLDGLTYTMDLSVSELRELVMDREAWRSAIHGVAKSWTWMSNWTELNCGQSKTSFMVKWVPWSLCIIRGGPGRQQTFNCIYSCQSKAGILWYLQRLYRVHLPLGQRNASPYTTCPSVLASLWERRASWEHVEQSWQASVISLQEMGRSHHLATAHIVFFPAWCRHGVAKFLPLHP